MHYLIKSENGNKTFVQLDEGGWTIYDSSAPVAVSIKDIEYIISKLMITAPRKMYGHSTEGLSLPHFIHAVSKISNKKTTAQFTLSHVVVDFNKETFETQESYEFDVKQWPEGYVKISKTS